MKRLNQRICFRICALLIAASLIIGVGSMYALAEFSTASAPAADPSPAAYVAQKNAASVVGILTYADEWIRTTHETRSVNIAQGSGAVIRDGGYVVTNNHVIEDGSSFKVLMPSGEKVDADLIGADPAMDLAVLKVADEYASQLSPVEIGSSADLLVGSTAIAIGNPGGEVLANTVTQGIVSALERSSVSASNATRSVAYIQHDAAINNGNSGGGLFNYRGQLVGINTLKYSGSMYSSISFEGLGFAIPIETAAKIVEDLIEHGRVIRPALGVTAAAYEGPEEPMNNYPPASVCIYTVNPGGAAEQAGLQAYDFIYKVNGVRVTVMQELTAQLDQFAPGDDIEVTVIRYKNASQPAQTDAGNYFGFDNWYGNDNSQPTQSNEVLVSGGYDELTVHVILEELK